VLNLLSLVLLLASLVFAGGVAAVYQYPSLAGLLPPTGAWLIPTQPKLVAVLPSLTPAPTRTPLGTPADAFPTLPPEWTPTDTPTATGTPLPATATLTPAASATGPTLTPGPTRASTGTAATGTPGGLAATPTRTRSAFAYELQNGAVTYLANFTNGSGCSWFSFVGQVFDLDGKPIIGLTIHLEGDGLKLDSITGSQPAVGPGGYELPLGNHPVDTTDTYRIQLRNNTGTPLSDTVVVRTYADCARNMVLVNFVQNH
jgi:hypothetical protein